MQEKLIIELNENQKLQLKYQTVRDKIASDRYDDVGSTLSSINTFSDVARKLLDADPAKNKSLLERISVSATGMIEKMSDIVWAVNAKRDQADDLAFRMQTFANELLEPRNIKFNFYAEPEILKMSIDMITRKNLFLIFKEVINNAAQYAECTEVDCRFSA